MRVNAGQASKPSPWAEVCDQLNALLRGWKGYFRYGTLRGIYREVDWYVADRVRHFLRRRHEVLTRRTRQFKTEYVFEDRKILRRGRLPRGADAPHALA